ncbi:MAG: fimbrillin family protein [Prevotella sp.]|jgi:hypothetical protein|nr:fimbrillin family protein [Prevotella sp.]
MITKRRNFVFRYLPGLFLSGLLLLSGCSQDDVSDVPAGSSAISFRAQGGMSSLKATTTGADYIRSFAVNAHYGQYDATGKFLIEGATVYRGEGGGNSWTYSPQAYFPTEDKGAVEFFAYSPSGSENVKAGLKAATDATQTITYEVSVPNGSATSQEDLLVARQTVEYSSVNSAYPSAAVGLQFHHALSRILVAASSSLGQEVPVVITGLALKNLYSKGDLSLSSSNIPVTGGWGYADNTPGAKVLWTNDTEASTIKDYAYSLPASGVHVGETPATVTGDDQGIFILPQATIGADVTNADRDGEFGLEISYTINGNEASSQAFVQFSDLVSSSSTASVTFEIGRQYVLNLTFGAGSGTGGGGDTPGGTDPDINIGAKISFSDLEVDPYPDNIQAPPPPPVPYPHEPVIWSQSNIYYDETADAATNVGALTFSETADHNLYQGIYFRWGSLVGVSASANMSSFSNVDYLFIPDVDGDGLYHKVQISALATHSDLTDVIGLFKASLALAPAVWTNVASGDTDALTALWTALPYATSTDVIPVSPVSATGRTERDDNALTTESASLYSSYKGDVCKYLVDKSSTNGNSFSNTTWRLPTSSEFGLKPAGNHTNSDAVNGITIGDYFTKWVYDDYSSVSFTGGILEDGTDSMIGNHYCTLNWVYENTDKPDFPASGNRGSDNGGLSYGNNGNFWSSSAYGTSFAYNLFFSSSSVNPDGNGNRSNGRSVRCVRPGE